MMLTHICPNCGKEHEMECTPEPDQLCSKCESRVNNIVKVEFWVDCGNCPMCKDERQWYIGEIEKLCKQRESSLKDIKVYD